jgi:SAM-dependent methyltransferase
MSVSTPSPASYAFDNDDAEAVDRHTHLSAILDGGTFARLASLGDLTGRSCLEVGAGGGSVARWLADRVGPTGRVLATDLNIRHLPAGDGYQVLAHDLINEPVPAGPWDVIHARLVLIHIAERRAILSRLAAALAPGGALVIEEWEGTFGKWVLDAPDPDSADLYEEYQATLGRLLTARGNDQGWGSRVHAALRAEGLVEVDTEVSSRSWEGGSPGALLIAANVAQLRAEFRAAGWTDERVERLLRLIADPRLVVRSHFLFATIGRRPRAAAGS